MVGSGEAENGSDSCEDRRWTCKSCGKRCGTGKAKCKPCYRGRKSKRGRSLGLKGLKAKVRKAKSAPKRPLKKRRTNHNRKVLKRDGKGGVHIFLEDLNDTGCHLFGKQSDRTKFKFIDGIVKNSRCETCYRRSYSNS